MSSSWRSKVRPAKKSTATRKKKIAHRRAHKQDFLDRAGIDALTDVSANQFSRMTADAVAIAMTAPFCPIGNSVQRLTATVTGPQTIRVKVFDSSDAAVANGHVSGLAVYWKR